MCRNAKSGTTSTGRDSSSACALLLCSRTDEAGQEGAEERAVPGVPVVVEDVPDLVPAVIASGETVTTAGPKPNGDAKILGLAGGIVHDAGQTASTGSGEFDDPFEFVRVGPDAAVGVDGDVQNELGAEALGVCVRRGEAGRQEERGGDRKT